MARQAHDKPTVSRNPAALLTAFALGLLSVMAFWMMLALYLAFKFVWLHI